MKSRVYDAALLILCAIALFIFAFMLNQIPPFSPESLFVNQWDTTLQTALPREATIAWWSPKCLPHPLQRLNFFLYPRRLRCFSYHETNDLLCHASLLVGASERCSGALPVKKTQAFSTWPNSSSTGVDLPKIVTATRRRLFS